jgi:eukaryotic-like serine/threonine-protein kinase
VTLKSGDRLGPYEVVNALGAGGMGEVWRARDTTLGRDVALKILPDRLALDSERLARFKREAQILASLNHPNIAAIHGFQESDGQQALVLELVEGPTLADRIAQGPIPVDEALPIAKQIAEALEAAHEQGIIHRDLKPANIKLRPDATVKVLDFGLAKATEPASAVVSSALSMSPTITSPAGTMQGVILGTAAYMSPEQAKGRPVDKRADVWAFGCVLYEMLTGRRCFDGDDVSDTFAAILRADPDWSVLPAQAPAAFQRLLRRCLEKDRKFRLSDMAMARIELRDAEVEASSRDSAAVPRVELSGRSTRRRAGAYVAAVALAVATGLAVWILSRPAETPRPIVRFSVPLPEQAQLSGTGRTVVALSPDGTNMAFVANQRLYLRAMNELEAKAIPGTEAGGQPGHARAPFFSPDGRWIGFWQEGQLRKVSTTGGAPATICDAPNPSGASWGLEDEIVFATLRGGIFRVPGVGGQAELIIHPESGRVFQGPQMLPGREWVLFTSAPDGTAVDQGQVVVQSRATGERRTLIDGARDARYVPSGHVVFGRGTTLFAWAFDVENLRVDGGAVPMLDGVANAGTTTPAMHVAISATGTLLYAPGTNTPTTSRLVQVTADGARSSVVDIAGMTWFPRFSPDGTRIAYGVSVGTQFPALGETLTDSDLWVLDVARSARTRVTFTGNNRFYPIWTRDGTRLTYADAAGDTNRLLSSRSDGSGGTETLLELGTRRFPTSWAPDGRTLALYATGESGTRDIWMLPVSDDKRTPTPLIETPFEERGAIFSPDGRWIAYVSNKSGQNDVYARPYPGPGDELTISVGGGQEPVWAPSGRQLFYRHDGKVMTVPVTPNVSSLRVDAARPVFDDPYLLDTSGAAGGVANYDISPDGRHFVMVEQTPVEGRAAGEAMPLQVILNWTEELKRRVPTR